MFAKPLIASALFAATVAMAQPALAGSHTVKFSDLDLSSPEGQARLDARIAAAARKVCMASQPDVTMADVQAGRRCFNAAVADARIKLDRVKPAALAAR